MFPTIGSDRVTGTAVKLSETPACVGPAAPRLGEHTGTVLSELLELSETDIRDLRAAGIIAG
jgi:crotonobetainyl-CoA:carnitine CoA-transferase CaiB-like acyl-CoA transferase